jgi:hypothetical protein
VLLEDGLGGLLVYYLSYKGFVQVKWLVVKNAIRTGFTSSDGHSVHALNNTASQSKYIKIKI